MIIIICYIYKYSAFLGTKCALHCKGYISSSSTNVQHPFGWYDGSHIAPERPPHTSYRWRGDSDEANQCMGMIRRPSWSATNGKIWPGCRGNTPTIFKGHPGIVNDHRESEPRFNVSSEGWVWANPNDWSMVAIHLKKKQKKHTKQLIVTFQTPLSWLVSICIH